MQSHKPLHTPPHEPPRRQLRWASRSHPGCIRENNEDYIACIADPGLWLLADGMGGHQAGEVAAQLACQIVSQSLRSGQSAKSAFSLAHKLILDQSQGQQSGMGSTLICLEQLTKGKFQLSWVGDSRAYRWRAGNLELLSHDHSYVQTLIDSGQINEKQAREHPEKNVITQCLGAIEYDAIEVETYSDFWLEGDLILLCSDGLNDELQDHEIAHILQQNLDLDNQLLNLENAALDAGGKDNVSMVAIQCAASEETQGAINVAADKNTKETDLNSKDLDQQPQGIDSDALAGHKNRANDCSQEQQSMYIESTNEQGIRPLTAIYLIIIFIILVGSVWLW